MSTADGSPGTDFERIRTEFGLVDGFPEPALAEAVRIAGRAPHDDRLDATDLPLVTIDPPGARDLDQALAITRTVLADRVGEEFDAIVLRAEGDSAEVFMTDPPVIAKCAGGEGLPEGDTVRVRLARVDERAREVSFEPA